MMLEKLDFHTYKNKTRSYTIINFRYIKDLSVKLETLKAARGT